MKLKVLAETTKDFNDISSDSKRTMMIITIEIWKMKADSKQRFEFNKNY